MNDLLFGGNIDERRAMIIESSRGKTINLINFSGKVEKMRKENPKRYKKCVQSFIKTLKSWEGIVYFT